MRNNVLDPDALIATHGRKAIAILTERIAALLREGDEVGALEADEVLQVIEKFYGF